MCNAESTDLESSSLLMSRNFACEGVLLMYSWFDDDDDDEEEEMMTTYFSFSSSFMNQAMPGLFCPQEEYAGPFILTECVRCFVFFMGCMIEFSLDSICLPFVACEISIVNWSL
jgi:hypothetical protein